MRDKRSFKVSSVRPICISGLQPGFGNIVLISAHFNTLILHVRVVCKANIDVTEKAKAMDEQNAMKDKKEKQDKKDKKAKIEISNVSYRSCF